VHDEEYVDVLLSDIRAELSWKVYTEPAHGAKESYVERATAKEVSMQHAHLVCVSRCV
jgi:hypothetical protein